MQSSHSNLQSTLLTIPRELRDEIFSHIVLPEHVFTSTSRPNAQTLHQSTRNPQAFIDTRIYLPARAPSNTLSICRQLREEFLDYICRISDVSTIPPVPSDKPAEECQSNILAARVNQEDEDMAERRRDTGTVRITMEINRAMRGNMGFFTPVRDKVSPRFTAMNFLLRRLQKVKFVVWGAMGWWEGPAQSVIDPLLVSVDEVLKLMPNVEDVDIDIFVPPREYLHWEKPEVRNEGIASWLRSSISLAKDRRFSRVDRRLMVNMPPDRMVTFYRQLEERKYDSSVPDKYTLQVSEGESMVSVENPLDSIICC